MPPKHPMPASRRLPASLAALICLGASAVAGADAVCDGKARQHVDSLGPVEFAMAAREAADCEDANRAAHAGELSQLSMSVARGSFDARYRWSKAADGRSEQHGVTITPLDGKRMAVRLHGHRDVNLRSGVASTAFKVENGIQVGALRSTASLSRQAGPNQRTTGAEVAVERALFGRQLSVKAEHGEWRVRESAQDTRRRARSAVAVELARRGAVFTAGYAHKREDLAMKRNIYAAGATVPLSQHGSQRRTASFRAEVSDPAHGRATQAFSISSQYSQRRSSGTVELRYARSQDGLQHTRIKFARAARGAMSVESSLDLTRGCGKDDTGIQLAARYRF